MKFADYIIQVISTSLPASRDTENEMAEQTLFSVILHDFPSVYNAICSNAGMRVHPCPSPPTPFLPSFLPFLARSFTSVMDVSSDAEILLADGDIVRIDEAATARHKIH